jgi:hypothetical protein
MNVGTMVAGIVCLGLIASSASAGGRVCLEAEASEPVVLPMRVVDVSATNAAGEVVPGASGGKYLEIPKGAGNPPKVNEGEAKLAFEIDEPGDYTLWGRACWLSECNSSFTMSIDEALPFTFGKDATYKEWHWVKAPPRLKQLTLARGKHVLTIRNRQDGVRLDQVLFVLDRRYVPVGVEDLTPAGARP